MTSKALECLSDKLGFFQGFYSQTAIRLEDQKLFRDLYFLKCMSGSSHIRSVLIGIEYRNCHQTLDVYLLFAKVQ